MGRRKLTLGRHCKGSHFTWGERLKLQYHYAGSPFSQTEYNADHAQINTEEKMKYKGPMPKSGRHYALVQRMSLLVLKHKYSLSEGNPQAPGSGPLGEVSCLQRKGRGKGMPADACGTEYQTGADTEDTEQNRKISKGGI